MNKNIASIVLMTITTAPVFAEVLWRSEPSETTSVEAYFKRLDTGNYPQDYCVNRGDEEGIPSSTAEVIKDPELGNVWRINKPINRKRGEFARFEGSFNNLTPKEGDDLYIAWQWKIDTADGAEIDKEITVFQWKSASPHNQNYPLNLEYDGELTLNAFGANYKGKVSQSSRRTVLWRKAVPQGEWVSLIIRIKVDKNDFGGIVQFWFNGVQQELDNIQSRQYQVKLSDDKKTVFHRTNDGRFVYPKWGVYNKKSCQYDVNVYFHEMKVGSTLNSVIPVSLK